MANAIIINKQTGQEDENFTSTVMSCQPNVQYTTNMTLENGYIYIACCLASTQGQVIVCQYSNNTLYTKSKTDKITAMAVTQNSVKYLAVKHTHEWVDRLQIYKFPIDL